MFVSYAFVSLMFVPLASISLVFVSLALAFHWRFVGFGVGFIGVCFIGVCSQTTGGDVSQTPVY